MRARLRAWLERLGNQFWLRPALVVLACLCLGQGGIWLEPHGSLAEPESPMARWGYSGGAQGARALLSAIASSAIGIASTIFSITIAALSLASGQMGPRLLRNFVRDSSNQYALGIFVGTFAYALIVLRTVRTQEEQAFVPHAAVTGAIILAIVCIGTLVWFVHHVATGINVEKVIESVHADLVRAVETRSVEAPQPTRVPFEGGTPVRITGSNYLQALDADMLADWAAATATVVKLRVRPGDYLPSGMPVAELAPAREGATAILERALTFGGQAAAFQDLEYPVRQLNEIAVRALSPGINDPFTAASVIDRFGDVLCRLAPRFLPTGIVERDGVVRLMHPVTTYGGLCDSMFHTVRQNADSSAFVLIRMLEVLGRVAQVERTVDRRAELHRHARLIVDVGKTSLTDPAAIEDLENRWSRFEQAADAGCAASRSP